MNQTLKLKGLSCPSCVVKIEKALSTVQGIEAAEVKFNSSRVDVTFDEAHIDIDTIETMLHSLGYHVEK